MANQKTQGISKKTAIIIFVLSLFIIILAGIVYRIVLPSETNTISQTTSSDLLYPDASWEEIKFDPNNNELNQLFAVFKNYETLPIPFPNGTLYEAQAPLEYPSVESYYESVLLKQDGWSSYEIPFDSFTLQSIIADGPCGGISGYLRSQDNQIQMIAIQRDLASCDPLSSTQQKLLYDYTIFISDPKPIEEIEDYIKIKN